MGNCGGARYRGSKKHMERVDIIESLLPPKPKDLETGEERPYHSARFQYCEELITICRQVCHPPTELKLEREVARLKHELYEKARRHSYLKISNAKLRQKMSQLDSTYDDHCVKETA